MYLATVFTIAVVVLAVTATPVLETDEELVRIPRHAQGQQAGSQQHGGSWSVGVERLPGGGSRLQADIAKNFYQSGNGNIRGQVYGQYDRTYGGPNNGQRDREIGVRVQGKF